MTTWTKTPPSEPGWYWVHNPLDAGDGEPEPWFFDGEEWNVCGNDFPCHCAPSGCVWWPVRIEPPEGAR